MRNIWLLALTFAIVSAGNAATLNATHSNEITSTGVSTDQYEQNAQYLDFGYTTVSGYTQFSNSFGVLDFDASSLANSGAITSLNLSLIDESYNASSAGTASVWAISDNVTTIEGSSLKANGTAPFYSNQLGTPLLLGTFAYQNMAGNTYNIDLMSGAAAGALNQVLANVNSSNYDIRLVLTSDTSFTSINGSTGQPGPQLSIETQPVPEPASMALLGLGVLALRKRRSA